MVRTTLESVSSQAAHNRIFIENAVSQSQVAKIFSNVVEQMMFLASRLKPFAFTAFTHLELLRGVWAKSIYSRMIPTLRFEPRAFNNSTASPRHRLRSLRDGQVDDQHVVMADSSGHPLTSHFNEATSRRSQANNKIMTFRALDSFTEALKTFICLTQRVRFFTAVDHAGSPLGEPKPNSTTCFLDSLLVGRTG